MDKELLERLAAEGVTEDDLKNPEKVKALAEKIEAENKANAEKSTSTDPDKILSDQLGRLQKALLKGGKPAEKTSPNTTLSELDVDNRVFTRTANLSEKQVEILKEYSKLPRNEGKSFEEIFKSTAVQAELQEIQAAVAAEDELDANANGGKLLETKNELYNNYARTGQEPETEAERRIVAEKGLEASGFRTF